MEKERKDRLGIAKQHLSRADKSLKAAQKLLDAELYADSLSRSYYAAFHSCYSGLYFLGFEPKSHKGVSNLLFLHMVESGLIDRQVLKYFSQLLEERGTADYGALPIIDKEDAETAIDHADFVLRSMREYINTQ